MLAKPDPKLTSRTEQSVVSWCHTEWHKRRAVSPLGAFHLVGEDVEASRLLIAALQSGHVDSDCIRMLCGSCGIVLPAEAHGGLLVA